MAVVAEKLKRVAFVYCGFISLAYLFSLGLAQVWLTHSSSYSSNCSGLKTEMENTHVEIPISNYLFLNHHPFLKPIRIPLQPRKPLSKFLIITSGFVGSAQIKLTACSQASKYCSIVNSCCGLRSSILCANWPGRMNWSAKVRPIRYLVLPITIGGYLRVV